MEREAAIAAVLGAVQERWGVHSLTRGLSSTGGVPPVLDRSARRALPSWWPGASGMTRPTVLEVGGPASCGKLSLSLLWLAAYLRGHDGSGLVAVVDEAGSFYPPAAAACGLDLRSLVVVRPPDWRAARESVTLLLGSAGFDAVLWPLDARARVSGLEASRLATLATRSDTVLLALVTDTRARPRERAETNGVVQTTLATADARLRVIGCEWLWRDGELAGARSQVRAERLRGMAGGQEWELSLVQHRPWILGPSRGADGQAGDERIGDGGIGDGGIGDGGIGDGGFGDGGFGDGGFGDGGFGDGRCPEADHLCLATAIPLGRGAAGAAGSERPADRDLHAERTFASAG
ncbi:MAG: hypothetical protein IT305_29565 [Chloroflexi bacterium]|nr:hypothetical protein [Chloroflexota bacterium]